MAKMLPIKELVPEGEFTDRIEILRDLENWYRNIKRQISKSLALISPRRMGKTAVLDKLVNTVFFKREYEVAPFYFKIKREETTLRKFLLDYYTTFFRQYVAYILQDPTLYADSSVDLKALMELKTEDERVRYIQSQRIANFMRRYEENDWQDARNHWEAMLSTPEFLASLLGINVAVIIDEFQDMKFYIYDTEDEKRIEPRRHHATDLTATYDRQSQSIYAPMLVSGSAVTMIFRTVMGGPLGGRFKFKYLKPMSIEDGATLAKKLLVARNFSITDELAIYLSSQVCGHPYYISCCAESDCPNKGFSSKDAIDRVIEFEVTRGNIFGFWETHFAENQELINQDNDIELGKKIIYYFTKYNNAPVDIDEIADKLKVNKRAVEEKIEKLYLADLVYRSDFKYYTFNDIMLMRYIQHRYEKGLTDIEKVNLELQGTFNYVKGKFLEIVVQNLMHRFNSESLDGELFGMPGETIIAPRFAACDSTIVKLPNSREYQVDIYGDYYDGDTKYTWVVECKYRKNFPMTSQEVQKAIEAKEAVRKSHDAQDAKLWFVSTGGFTDDAIAMIKQNGCLFSGQDEINEIARLYDVGVKIIAFE